MTKAAIIIDSQLPTGLLANAVACITSGLFLDGQELVGPKVEGKDVSFIPITKVPILILKKTDTSFAELIIQAKKLNLKMMVFTHEAQSTTNYEEYIERVQNKAVEEVTVIGLGVVGGNKEVNSLIGSLPMLR